jgi:transposase
MDAESSFAAWMGLDWGDESHSVCLRCEGSDRLECFLLEQKATEIHQWVAQLRLRFGGRPVAIALEQSRGALLYALMQYDFLVLFPINPKAFCSYRKALRLSGAKDDPGDAKLLLQFATAHQGQLKAWSADDVSTRSLRLLVEQRRKLVEDHTRLVNRLSQQLKEYFPQVLEWFSQVTSHTALDFLTRWPTLEKAQRAHNRSLQQFFHSHRSSAKIAQEKIQQIRAATPLTQDPAILAVHPSMVGICVRQLRVLQDSIAQLEQLIAAHIREHSDAFIFESFPGAGPVLAPRLLVAYGSDRERFDAPLMQSFSGIAPVTKQSGNSRWVHHRFVCPKFLKQTFHEFAQCSVPHSTWANAYYHQQREKGSSQHQAIRALAYKWIRIITRCWKDRTPYCEQTYLDALRRSGSPLVKLIEARVA